MLNLFNLDETVRALMVSEFDRDAGAGKLYMSPRLNALGTAQYPLLLRNAMLHNDDVWLADQLRAGLLNTHEQRRTKNGTSAVRVPITAPDTLAEGEFNRFYVRAVCVVAITAGNPTVEVYRARESANPREISINLIGRRFPADTLLNDLRTNVGVGTALHLPPGPNSGLSVKL